MGLEKLADQEFNAGDVPPHLEDRAVLLCVGKIKRVHRSRTDMLLPNYTCANDRVKKERGGEMMIKKTRVCVRTDLKSLRYLPVCMLAWLRSSGRLCTPSNELKW